LDEIRKRTDRRGWSDVTAVGDCQYCGEPAPATVSYLRQMWPEVKWFSQQHGFSKAFRAVEDGVRVPLIACTTIWNEGRVRLRGYEGLWRTPAFVGLGFCRNRHRDWSPLHTLESLSQEMIYKGLRGVGPLGANYWPLDRLYSEGANTPGRDLRGRRRVAKCLGGASALGPQCSTRALVVPGPEGPVLSQRFEAFRKGVQTSEALIYLQKALEENRLSADLSTRVNAGLTAHDRFYTMVRGPGGHGDAWTVDYWVWTAHTDREREKLFSLCADVAAAIDSKR
jgi:hypothetical protein